MEKFVIAVVKRLILFINIVLLFVSGCKKGSYFQRRLFLMDTFWDINVKTLNKKKADKVFSILYKELKRIERRLNVYDPESEIGILNRTKRVSFNEDEVSLIKDSIYIGKLTKGAFDISIFPLRKLWKFNKSEVFRSKEKIERIRESVNFSKIKVIGNDVVLEKNMEIDLGGIAKGFALKKAKDILISYGIKDALINAGGDIYALGRYKSRPWRIGIQHPRKRGVFAVVNGENKAVVTSGDYERFFMYNGKRYSHIIDPHTGYPSDRCQSVTIITDDPILADGLATGIFVMGPEDGLILLERLPDVEGLIVDRNGRIFKSKGFKCKFIHK